MRQGFVVGLGEYSVGSLGKIGECRLGNLKFYVI